MRSKIAGFAKVAIWLAIVVVVLATVKWISISSGATSGNAIAAIRVAQHDLFEAKKCERGVDTPKPDNAEGALNLAWAALKEKRYEGAIAEAHKASQLTRGVVQMNKCVITGIPLFKRGKVRDFSDLVASDGTASLQWRVFTEI